MKSLYIIAGLFPWLFGLVKYNIDEVNSYTTYWAIAFMGLLALLGTIMSLILFFRDWKLGKIPWKAKAKSDIMMTTDEI